MDLFKAFGLRKDSRGIDSADDAGLINKLHSFWTHIDHPIVGLMDREDMHTMGIEDLLERMNGRPAEQKWGNHPKTGKRVPSFIPENGYTKGRAPFPTPPHKLADLPPDLVDLVGKPSSLDRNSLKAGLDNPKHWGLGDFFPGENN